MAIDIATEIARQLALYSNFVKEEITEVAEMVATDAVRKLEQTSPERTGDYAKGWTKKKNKSGYTVHNATDYQLTHLLEKGHVNRDGSRTDPRVHIKPVEDESNREFENELIRRVSEW
mgnify:CR=1 FL=1